MKTVENFEFDLDECEEQDRDEMTDEVLYRYHRLWIMEDQDGFRLVTPTEVVIWLHDMVNPFNETESRWTLENIPDDLRQAWQDYYEVDI